MEQQCLLASAWWVLGDPRLEPEKPRFKPNPDTELLELPRLCLKIGGIIAVLL